MERTQGHPYLDNNTSCRPSDSYRNFMSMSILIAKSFLEWSEFQFFNEAELLP